MIPLKILSQVTPRIRFPLTSFPGNVLFSLMRLNHTTPKENTAIHIPYSNHKEYVPPVDLSAKEEEKRNEKEEGNKQQKTWQEKIKEKNENISEQVNNCCPGLDFD